MKLTKKPIEIDGIEIIEIDFIEIDDEQVGLVMRFRNDELPEWFGEAMGNNVIDVANLHPSNDGSGDIHGDVVVRMFNPIGQSVGVVKVIVGDWIMRGPTGEIYSVPEDKFDITYETPA